ncbi:uncharacterized protein A4U43_C08F5780 [Asparagus officinalis]|uniref:pentatricopeptide repeat-containing protein At2g13600-like n=1 Tax=Asparagus officinalis TaxID=4686 RepID=UPI00098DECB4|nr:pentatricopeptide repeat-containing protein At2g13600-like [Asparagus officinalis]ONK59374.1 uncharacterized protein A4U43_C08F5780 [Asparagus officinalis]
MHLSPFKRKSTIATTVLQTKEITLLSRQGKLNDALNLFDQMPNKNQVTWNATLSALLAAGQFTHALKLFDEMPKKNATSYSTMIAGLSRSGAVFKAREIFDSVPISKRNVFSWTAMMCCYVQNAHPMPALNLFRHQFGKSGIWPNAHTFSVLIKACGLMQCGSIMRQIHCLSVKLLDLQRNDVIFVENGLINVYAKLGDLGDAERVFSCMKDKDLATMNTMMDAYAFHLVIDKALDIFYSIEKKDALSWNIVMSGLLDCRRGEEALKLFLWLMRSEVDLKPNSSTYTIVLSLCATLAMIEFGRQIHASVVKIGFYVSNIFVCNSLMTMYARFGLTKELEQVFDEMLVKDVISWNSVIQGLGQNGCARKALEIAEITLNSKIYNHNTFIAILTCCSHGGFIDEGMQYFNSMGQKYGIEPTSDHYVCILDMLARAGKLQEAHEFLQEKGLESNSVAWETLLSACLVHGSSEIGEIAAKNIQNLEPNNVRSYLTMANAYSRTGRAEESRRVLDLMRNKDLRKNSARSWII